MDYNKKREEELKNDDVKTNKDIKKSLVVVAVSSVALLVVGVGILLGGQNQTDAPTREVHIVEEGYEYQVSETIDESMVAEDESGEVLLTEDGEPLNIPVIKVKETIKLEEITDTTKPEAIFGEANKHAEEQEALEEAPESAAESEE